MVRPGQTEIWSSTQEHSRFTIYNPLYFVNIIPKKTKQSKIPTRTHGVHLSNMLSIKMTEMNKKYIMYVSN